MAAGAELLTRLFLGDITEALRADNSYLAYCKRDDGFVNNNSVELPHAGADPAIVVDRSSFPATAVQRTDVATNYVLEEFSTTPTHLQFSEALVVNYNKRSSILDGHTKALKNSMGDKAAYKWALTIDNLSASNVPTTGTARATDAPGSTALPKALTKADILAGKLIQDRDNVPSMGRYLLIPPSMLGDILNLDEFTRMDAYGRSNIPDGWVGRIFGYDVIMRSRVVVYDATDDPKDPDAATAITDTSAALMWHPDSVRAALGSIQIFTDAGRAEWYGDLFSTAVRFGAIEARNDSKGIVVLREDV